MNLWHGDGPKDIRRPRGRRDDPSTCLVGSTRLFSGHQAAGFDVPEDRVLSSPATRAPTSSGGRSTRLDWPASASPATSWCGCRPSAAPGPSARCGPSRRRPIRSTSGPAELGVLLEGLRQRGIQLVIKPHPMDAEERRWDGAVTITDADLVRAQVSLYGVLGQARGLVTDYSSVWVDYLLLDRPLAFLVPDRDTYSRTLVPADVLDWVPGELVGRRRPLRHLPGRPRRRRPARRVPPRRSRDPGRPEPDPHLRHRPRRRAPAPQRPEVGNRPQDGSTGLPKPRIHSRETHG